MRYIDIINEDTDDITLNKIKKTKWYNTKNKVTLYRGSLNVYKDPIFIHVEQDRIRKPRDMKQEVHDNINTKSFQKLGVNIRNGMFMTNSYEFANIYGTIYVVIPDDDAVIYYSTKFKDFYIHINNTKTNDIDKNISDYVNSLKPYDYTTETKNEIIGFGGFYIVPLEYAKRLKLINGIDEEYIESSLLDIIHTNISTTKKIKKIKELFIGTFPFDFSVKSAKYLLSNLEVLLRLNKNKQTLENIRDIYHEIVNFINMPYMLVDNEYKYISALSLTTNYRIVPIVKFDGFHYEQIQYLIDLCSELNILPILNYSVEYLLDKAIPELKITNDRQYKIIDNICKQAFDTSFKTYYKEITGEDYKKTY